MNEIQHRINKINELISLREGIGTEIDVRYHEDKLILDHDPFDHHNNEYDLLDEYLFHYSQKRRGILILNVKTEGVEEKCLELLKKHSVENFFFLDLSMPYFVKYAIYSDLASKHLAVRFSEHENIEYALSFAGKVDWVWVDCFSKLPLTNDIYMKLKDAGFKICLVSPELQKHSLQRINEFKDIMKNESIVIDAVCSKRLDLWK